MSILTKMQCSSMVDRLNSLRHTAMDEHLKTWLEHELDGYAEQDPLPWYRIAECRQRGLFTQDGEVHEHHETCQIHDQSLSQHDLAKVKFLLLRAPVSVYLNTHNPVLERWPMLMLVEYQHHLIPGQTCLHAWQEPLVCVRDRLMHGIEQMLQEYNPDMCDELCHGQHSLRCIQHKHWQI